MADLDYPGPIVNRGPFDAIVSIETAEHLKFPEVFIEACHRSLKPDGVFVFAVPTTATRDVDPYHLRDWSATRWKGVLQRAGFRLCETHENGFRVPMGAILTGFPTTWRQKLAIAWRSIRAGYAPRRIWEWGVLRQFRWEWTMFVCVKAAVPVEGAIANGRTQKAHP